MGYQVSTSGYWLQLDNQVAWELKMLVGAAACFVYDDKGGSQMQILLLNDRL
jgi:hypothetical protein